MLLTSTIEIEELPEHPLTKSQKENALTTSSLHRNVRSTESTLSITRHEYYIQNLTGVPMSYIVGRDDPVPLKSRKKQPLASSGRINRRSSSLTNTINNRVCRVDELQRFVLLITLYSCPRTNEWS